MRRYIYVTGPVMLLLAVGIVALAGDPVEDVKNRRMGTSKNFVWRVRREGTTKSQADGLELLITENDKAKKTIKGTFKRYKRKGNSNKYEKDPDVTIEVAGKVSGANMGKVRPKHRFLMAGIDEEGDLFRILGAYRSGKTAGRDDDDQIVIRIQFFDALTFEPLQKPWAPVLAVLFDDNVPCDEIPDDDVMTEEEEDEPFEPETPGT